MWLRKASVSVSLCSSGENNVESKAAIRLRRSCTVHIEEVTNHGGI